MEEYAVLIKRIALDNEQDDIYRLMDVFLGFTEDYIREVKGKGVPEEDLRQECALVIAETFFDGSFLEINGRRDRLLTGDDDIAEEILKEIIHEVSSGCEIALAGLTETEEMVKKAGLEVLAKVNVINEGTQRFIEEYGIKPTPSELAEFLDIDEDLIIEAVELSGYEIKDIDFDTPVSGHKT